MSLRFRSFRRREQVRQEIKYLAKEIVALQPDLKQEELAEVMWDNFLLTDDFDRAREKKKYLEDLTSTTTTTTTTTTAAPEPLASENEKGALFFGKCQWSN